MGRLVSVNWSNVSAAPCPIVLHWGEMELAGRWKETGYDTAKCLTVLRRTRADTWGDGFRVIRIPDEGERVLETNRRGRVSA